MSHESPPNMQKPLMEAMDYLKHKRWSSASTVFDMILQADPNCDIARAGKIMVKYHISTIETIPKCEQDITAEEQMILITAFTDTQTDMTSILNLYRMNISSAHDKAKKQAYIRAKEKAKSCRFIPKKFTSISGARCSFLSEYDFESLNLSCLEINKVKQEFLSFDKYKDSDQCAELCGLTYELVSKASNFIPRTKWAKNFPLFKFFGLPCLLYALLSWILVFFGNFQLFTAPFQTVKRFFSAISSGNFSHPLNALIISFIVIIAILSVFLVFYLFSRIFIGLIFYGLWDGDGIFYIPQVIAILISPFVFFFLSPIVSIVFLVIIGLRIKKQRKLIKYFTACNAELIQRMEVLSKQCSMLNPKRILRELF